MQGRETTWGLRQRCKWALNQLSRLEKGVFHMYEFDKYFGEYHDLEW